MPYVFSVWAGTQSAKKKQHTPYKTQAFELRYEGRIIEATVSHRKIASNIHRLGPKDTQQVANELKNNKAPSSAAPHRRRRFALPPVVIVCQFICQFCV